MKARRGALILLPLLAAACSREVLVGTPVPSSAASAALVRLAGERLLFGHQSVGRNLVDGLGELAGAVAVPGLLVRDARASELPPGPLFLEAGIGVNGDPAAKVRDFDRLVRALAPSGLDLALMKLCYVDVGTSVDRAGLFGLYRDTLAGLRRDFPRVTFVHVTVPLTAAPTGLKAVAGRILRRGAGGEAENAAREAYNDLLRAEYSGREPLFDLAGVERNGRGGPAALDPRLTDDGGHLNAEGRRTVASAFAVYLAGIAPD